MSPDLELTPNAARLLHLAAQGLLRRPRRGMHPDRLLRVAHDLCLLQIDTIQVVARSPWLVLYSRLGAYPKIWLDELLVSADLAEAWAHEACLVPAAHMPMHAAYRSRRHTHWAYRMAARVRAEHGDRMQAVLQHVRHHGPVRSADFAPARKDSAGWWGWKLEKSCLEALFAQGELMVARRERFQRVYDLTERVWPRLGHAAATARPTAGQARQWFIAASVRALGVARPEWIGDYFRLGRVTADECRELTARGELLQVRVKGWDTPGLVHRDILPLAERAARGRLRATYTAPLSPFDPVVWDRDRARTLFGFAYTLECYRPASKRRYGYFVLPWLHRGRLVARMDAKAHRRDGVFEVRSFHFEPEARIDSRGLRELAHALAVFAAWHETPSVHLARVFPAALERPLRAALRQCDAAR